MSWPYMNSILKSWHAKGLHRVRDIEAGDAAPARPRDASPSNQSQKEERMARNIAALKRAARKTDGGDPSGRR